MKRIITLLFILMGTVSIASAAYVGNPAVMTPTEDAHSSVSVEGTYLFERELEDNNAEIDELQSGAVRLAFSPEDGAYELYGLAGAMRFETDQGAAFYDTDFGLVYGAGLKARLWDNEEGGAIGLDAQYRRSTPDIDDSTSATDDDLTYQEWQAALAVSQKIGDNVTPYVGVKYNDISITDVPGFADQSSDEIFGAFAGIDIEANNILSLNLEGNFLNETSVAGEIELEF